MQRASHSSAALRLAPVPAFPRCAGEGDKRALREETPGLYALQPPKGHNPALPSPYQRDLVVCRKFSMGGPYCRDERDEYAAMRSRELGVPFVGPS
jgi:hypothetical protein